MADEDIFQGISLLNIEECRKIVKQRLKTTDTEIVNINTTTLGEVPAGFLGDHYRVKVKVAINKNSDGEPNKVIDLQFFVKTIPNNHLHSKFAHESGAHKKERYFFSELLLDLCKYQVSDEVLNGTLSNHLSISQKPGWTAESFLATSKMIVLDDLSIYGYRTLDKNLTMDFDHCIIVLQTLARFHASSIIFEEKEAERTGVACCLKNMHPDIFQESIWNHRPGHPGKQIGNSFVKSMQALLKYQTTLKQDSKHYDLVSKSISEIFEMICEFVKTSSDFKNVITHGDLWANNILLRYDSTQVKPQEVRFVDFQLLRYTAPAHDVICFIYLNTRRSFREKYLLDLALAYHVALKDELQRHNFDVEKLVPWTEFKASLKHYHGLGVLTTNLYFPTTLMPESAMAEIFASEERFDKFMFVDRSDDVCQCFEKDANYQERLTEALDELIEYLTKK